MRHSVALWWWWWRRHRRRRRRYRIRSKYRRPRWMGDAAARRLRKKNDVECAKPKMTTATAKWKMRRTSRVSVVIVNAGAQRRNVCDDFCKECEPHSSLGEQGRWQAFASVIQTKQHKMIRLICFLIHLPNEYIAGFALKFTCELGFAYDYFECTGDTKCAELCVYCVARTFGNCLIEWTLPMIL